MNLGIFGGTFNPVHKGHITASLKFYDDAKLDSLLIIPDRVPPHKEGVVADSSDRLNMLHLVYDDNTVTEGRNITVSEIELDRPGKSYTIVTLREIQKDFPDAKLFLYVGSDMFYTLESWYEGPEILRTCTIYTAARKLNERDSLLRFAENYRKKYGTECIVADFHPIVMSSTEIRDYLADLDGENCCNFTNNLLTDSVKRYIMENGLYLGPDASDDSFSALIERVKNELPSLVTPKRLSHILAVRDTAIMLSDYFVSLGLTLSRNKVELSALLHDITKCMNQTELCEKYSINLSQDDLACPETVHAITGAHYSKSVYGIDDEVFHAIERHTVGFTDMSLVEKIIFVSDYCEETRSHPQCQESRLALLDMMKATEGMPSEDARHYALLTLDYITAEILGKTIMYLKSTDGFIHPNTRISLNYILQKHNSNKDFANLAKKYL